MSSDRSRFDIFLCSHSGDYPILRRLLSQLRPYGTIHLGSSFMTREELDSLADLYDHAYEPHYDENGYENFALWCVRDINRLATAPHFIKLDCDVELQPDWMDYVEECLAEKPDTVLFGTHSGTNRVDYDISGPLVKRRLGSDVRVAHGLKVNGSFYVGRTEFFQEHDRTMQELHDLIWAFREGRRIRPSHIEHQDSLESELEGDDLVRFRGTCRNRQMQIKEDELRSLTVHYVGAGKRMFVRDAAPRIVLPDKIVPPSRWKLFKKWLKRQVGVPMYHTK